MIYNIAQFPSYKQFICPFDKCHKRIKNKAGLTIHIRLMHNEHWGKENES